MAMRQEEITILSDGKDLPGKTLEDWAEPGCQTVFPVCPADGSTFVVDVLIDAAGISVRQEQVALQAYIIAEL